MLNVHKRVKKKCKSPTDRAVSTLRENRVRLEQAAPPLTNSPAVRHGQEHVWGRVRCLLGWVFRHCGVGTPIDPHDLLRSLRWTPVGVGPQPGYTRRLGKQ